MNQILTHTPDILDSDESNRKIRVTTNDYRALLAHV